MTAIAIRVADYYGQREAQKAWPIRLAATPSARRNVSEPKYSAGNPILAALSGTEISEVRQTRKHTGLSR